MNWGRGIAIALILFIGFIVYLAVVLMSHKVDLESEDYYLKEITYEDEITALKNAKANEAIKVTQSDDHVVVQIPAEKDYTELSLEFIRPNNEKLDKTYEIKDTKTFTVPKTQLENGQYNIKISYTFKGKSCLQKEKIYI
jgi:hypothetical protein